MAVFATFGKVVQQSPDGTVFLAAHGYDKGGGGNAGTVGRRTVEMGEMGEADLVKMARDSLEKFEFEEADGERRMGATGYQQGEEDKFINWRFCF
ncbi:hypothetical protein MKZ38_008522 [Zalerion maritima]|uniref:Uncharacterized protein n=1 Tax=Zalerion maritima TaxID=339359 RepID=A0AAD5WP25_9PEZI|nr:hypothetical protein MKZ38_008522 [Zalerion maritima]